MLKFFNPDISIKLDSALQPPLAEDRLLEQRNAIKLTTFSKRTLPSVGRWVPTTLGTARKVGLASVSTKQVDAAVEVDVAEAAVDVRMVEENATKIDVDLTNMEVNVTTVEVNVNNIEADVTDLGINAWISTKSVDIAFTEEEAETGTTAKK